jgi:phosphoesterase RecJ-like protein
MTEPIPSILSELEAARRILILGHIDPDGDSAGSVLALAGALGDKDVYCYSQGALSARYRFMDPEGLLQCRVDTEKPFDLAVAMEAPGKDRLGQGLEMISESTRVINIDHHQDNELYGHINWVNSEAAALGEMIYELLQAKSVPVTDRMATCLYTAILTDTGRFQYKGTSSRTLSLCGELVKLGANPTEITRHVYFGLPFAYLRLMRSALGGMEEMASGRILAFTLHPEDFSQAGAEPQDAEGLIDLTLVSDQVRIGMLFRQPAEGKVKVSFRSQDSIDVGALASEWGGGGHKNASGCTVDGTIADVKRSVLQRAEQFLGQP